MIKNFFSDHVRSIIFTIIVLALGTTFYFAFDLGTMKSDPEFYRTMRIKVAFNDEGILKLFTDARPELLGRFKAVEGHPVPLAGELVMGADEARMMRAEGLFRAPGDSINNLFGISPVIGGILENTGSIVDDMHFLGDSDYALLEGSEHTVFIRLTNVGMPKTFYYMSTDEPLPPGFVLAEGSADDYTLHTMTGKVYVPLILGKKEADMMRDEKLFWRPGDIIPDFFGNDVIVVGILAETNTSIDMMHLTPLDEAIVRGY
jgi:hypothetical protein